MQSLTTLLLLVATVAVHTRAETFLATVAVKSNGGCNPTGAAWTLDPANSTVAGATAEVAQAGSGYPRPPSDCLRFLDLANIAGAIPANGTVTNIEIQATCSADNNKAELTSFHLLSNFQEIGSNVAANELISAAAGLQTNISKSGGSLFWGVDLTTVVVYDAGFGFSFTVTYQSNGGSSVVSFFTFAVAIDYTPDSVPTGVADATTGVADAATGVVDATTRVADVTTGVVVATTDAVDATTGVVGIATGAGSTTGVVARATAAGGESASNAGTIVGAVFAGLFVAACSVGLFLFLRWQRKQRSEGIVFAGEEKEDGVLSIGSAKLNSAKPLEDVQVFEKIGAGNFGDVYRGLWKGETVAVKTIISGDIAELEAELEILRRLNHPCIVRYYGLVVLPHGGGSAIVLEYCSGGSLDTVLRAGQVPRERLPSLALQIARGLEYLAGEGILHRDLATRNILRDASGRCRLTDFGLARAVDNGETYMVTSAFPVRWSAPEVLAERGFTSQSDVYSLAITLWELFSAAATPFVEIATNSAVTLAVVSGARPPRPLLIPTEIFGIIERCWQANPLDRPSARQVAAELAGIVERLGAVQAPVQVATTGGGSTRDNYGTVAD